MSGCDFSGQPPLWNFPATSTLVSHDPLLCETLNHIRQCQPSCSKRSCRPNPMPHLTCEASTACEVCTTLQPIFCGYLSGTISPSLCISDHGPDRPVAFFCYIDSHVFQFCYTIQTNDNSKKGVIKLPFSCTPSEDKVMIEWGLPVSLLALAIYWSEVVDHRCKTCCYIEEGSTGVEQWCARWWYDSIHNFVVLQMTYHNLTTYLNREKSVTEEIKPILQSLKLILLIKPW